MANLFAAGAAVSSARAATPACDVHQRVDPVTAVALPAANRRGCPPPGSRRRSPRLRTVAAARSRPAAGASKRAGATTCVSPPMLRTRPPSASAGTGPSRSPARTRAADHRRRCPLGRKREGERHPAVDVGRLRPGGLPVPGPAAGTAHVARPRSSSRSGLPDSRPARSRPALRSRDFPPRRSPDSRSLRGSRCPPPSIPQPRSIAP